MALEEDGQFHSEIEKEDKVRLEYCSLCNGYIGLLLIVRRSLMYSLCMYNYIIGVLHVLVWGPAPLQRGRVWQHAYIRVVRRSRNPATLSVALVSV